MLPEIRPLVLNTSSLEETAKFLSNVFENAKKFSPQYLNWLYLQNPVGPALGHNAFDGSQLIGHYALIPFSANHGGVERKGLLSVNTGVASQARIKGIFTTLAQKSMERAVEAGFEFVVGVANAHSAPGFINRLGFQDVGGLEPRIFWGTPPLIDFSPDRPDYKDDSVVFIPVWTLERLNWRLQNPGQRYRALRNTAPNAIFGETPVPGFKASLTRRSSLLEMLSPSKTVGTQTVGTQTAATHQIFRPLTIWTGLQPHTISGGDGSVVLPKFLRPSPLRFIFRDLKDPRKSLDSQKVLFEPLDFDVF